MMTLNGLTLDNSPIFRRVIQVVIDLARRPLSGLRILDLGSAHGAYSIELAGAIVSRSQPSKDSR